MAKPQSAAKLQQLGGELRGDSDRQLICKAFLEAVDDFCNTRSLGANRSFNDYFFTHLANQGQRGQQIAGAIQREVPFILERGAQGLQSLGQAANVASSGSGLAQQLAQRMMSASAGAARGLGTTTPLMGTGLMGVGNALLGAMYTGWIRFGMQNSFNLITRGTRIIFIAPRVYPVIPDGVYNSRVFEIKGPRDRLRGRQAGDYQRCSVGGPPYVVSCKSCAVNCSGGCPQNVSQGQLP